MNRVYRLVWSQVQNAWVAVAETARGRGQGSSRKFIAAALSLFVALFSAQGLAAPSGGQVVSGAASIAQSGATTTILQSSQSLSLTWQSFNVAPKETVNFLQPSAAAIAVNRTYDTGAVSGDSGAMISAELRHDLGTLLTGQWQAVAFVDSTHVTINKNVWAAGDNSATVNGASMGLNWTGKDRWSARIYVASPFGPKPTLLASTASARAWLEVDRGF